MKQTLGRSFLVNASAFKNVAPGLITPQRLVVTNPPDVATMYFSLLIIPNLPLLMLRYLYH